MYVPAAFQVEDLDVLHDFIERHSFATLVTSVDRRPFATHLPLLLDRTRGEFGTLLGHVAKPNSHWRGLEAQAESLAIFHGPHAYISPSWYRGDAPAVPTWNYAVVHAYGPAQSISDERWIDELLERMVATYEADFDHPWRYDMSATLRKQFLQGVVGVELIELDRHINDLAFAEAAAQKLLELIERR